MQFEIVCELHNVETFAVGREIRELDRPKEVYGVGRWRKRKGLAQVRLENGAILRAEIRWYEASGIEKREFKIKRFV
jgi:hypothetical protein